MPENITFSTGTVQYYFKSRLADIENIAPKEQCILITDSTIAGLYPDLVTSYRTIVIPAGEEHKKLKTLNIITEQLLEMQAHRKSLLIGVGGGMVTDITGLMASVYMRGTGFGFVPTTLLGMVDAAIGGKNLLGTIHQPEFILYDTSFLETLPTLEWSNGFAEIIKYACIFDASLFETLQKNSLEYYRNNDKALDALIHQCAGWKNKSVQEDEHERGIRKLLNFGHTAGHAIETLYSLSHGQAVALGMLIACRVSESINGIDTAVYDKLSTLLVQYKLPSSLSLHTDKLMDILIMDKKRNDDAIDYIVLKNIGEASIKTISFDIIRNAIDNFVHAGNH